MLNLQVLNLVECLVLVKLEAIFPATVEVLHVFLTDLDVLANLSLLNVTAQLFLENNDFGFKEPNLLHQVLVELVLMHLAALCRKKLHLFLDQGEDEDLLVLVQHAITALVEDVNELLRRADSQQVVNVLTALVKYQSNVSLI